VPIWIDEQARIAHAKTMVIDGAVTLTGSMNWTRGAAANSEDLNLISSSEVAAAYAAHWHERLALSVRFDRREDWCRVGSSTAPMTDGLLRRLFWRVVDHLDYIMTLARLRILDALAGPLPETPADRQRQWDRERIKRTFPEIEPVRSRPP